MIHDSMFDKKKSRKVNRGLLSGAYRHALKTQAPEDIKTSMGLEDGSTMADAVASQLLKRAIGLVPDDKICFRAITELRETTEGKTPDKIIASGTNPELAALAKMMQGPPAPTDSEAAATAEDKSTEDAEEDFHGDEGLDEE